MDAMQTETETPKTFGHTAHYEYLNAALQAQWNAFHALEQEMLAFAPKPASAFAERRLAQIEHLKRLNPDKSVEHLSASVDRDLAFLTSDRYQYHEQFDERHMTQYVTAVMLSTALSEALINAILALGLADAEAADLFPLIEKAELKQKWLLGPKSFAPKYKFPRDRAIHETLVQLIRQRNALVHHKIELEVNGKKVLEGSPFERLPYHEELTWLRRFYSLPYDLADHARNAIPRVPMMLLLARGPIPRAEAHDAA